jgi:hypothetical protein
MKQDSNLDFDGMKGDGVNRAKNRFAGNHSGLTAVVNAGRGPTKGNQDYNARQGKHAEPPTRGLPKVAPGKDMFPASANPQNRGQGGTQVKGYKDADRINMNGYSMGDGEVVKGKRPVPAGKTDGINYGPKKQY